MQQNDADLTRALIKGIADALGLPSSMVEITGIIEVASRQLSALRRRVAAVYAVTYRIVIDSQDERASSLTSENVVAKMTVANFTVDAPRVTVMQSDAVVGGAVTVVITTGRTTRVPSTAIIGTAFAGDDSREGSATGAIAGGVVGVFILGLGIAGVGYFVMKRLHQKGQQGLEEKKLQYLSPGSSPALASECSPTFAAAQDSRDIHRSERSARSLGNRSDPSGSVVSLDIPLGSPSSFRAPSDNVLVEEDAPPEMPRSVHVSLFKMRPGDEEQISDVASSRWAGSPSKATSEMSPRQPLVARSPRPTRGAFGGLAVAL